MLVAPRAEVPASARAWERSGPSLGGGVGPPERQRRSIHQPRVGATPERLPWVRRKNRANHNGVASGRAGRDATLALVPKLCFGMP